MIRSRTTTKLASAVALLGIVLRLLVPALHTHGDSHGVPASSEAVATVCSCGVVHATPGSVRAGDEEDGKQETVDVAPEVHFCLACAIEEGTPADCPPTPEVHTAQCDPAPLRPWSTNDVFVGKQVRLPAPRAPPGIEF